MLKLKPNSNGYICHWLISGADETLYKTDYYDPNQLAFEKHLREIIADDNLKEVPTKIKIGERGLHSHEWRYYQANNNWFVDVSRFYTLLTKVELYASTLICAPSARKIKVRIWTYEAIELWLNGKRCVVIKEPVYKPIKYADVELQLFAGENDIFIRAQNLGVRDTRNLFGIQIKDDFSDLLIKTHNFEKASEIIKVDNELSQIVLRNNMLISASKLSVPITVSGDTVWDGVAPMKLSGGSESVILSASVEGVALSRTLENSVASKPIYMQSETMEEHRERAFERAYENLKSDSSSMSQLDAVMCNVIKDRISQEDYGRIRKSFADIKNRTDCADFKLACLLKITLLAGDKLPCDLLEEIKAVTLEFRYWMDEHGADGMCFWSENHAIEFYSCQLMAGKLYPEDVFLRSGRLGSEQYRIANERCREWLDSIESTKFEEFLSPGYMGITAGALMKYVDYGEADVSARATVVLDALYEMMFMHAFDGAQISPYGRIYGDVIKPFKQSFQSTYSYFNKDVPISNSIPLSFLSSNYKLPEHIPALMGAEINKTYQSGNAEISICKTKNYILTSVASERSENFVGGWSGTEVLKENPYETGNFSFMYVKALNEKYHGTTLFQHGVYGYQQHIWSAALSCECVVLVNHPGATAQMAPMRPGYWYGNGIMPAVTQWDNRLLAIYSLEEKHPIEFTHVYFPHHTFDEVIRRGNWLFGKCGGGMIALWCNNTLIAHNDVMTDCEYRSYGQKHAYVCICSDTSEYSELESFASACLKMNITFDEEKMLLSDGEGHSISYVAKFNDSQII